ncbi:MAG: hypothetical protein ACXVPK_12725, partial [Tumebacillaceae bacterium]
TSLLSLINLNEEEKTLLIDRISTGELLIPHWSSFPSAEKWQEMTQFFVPALQSCIHLLLEKGSNLPELQAWIKSYVEKVNPALQIITQFYQQKVVDRMQQLKSRVGDADPEWGAANTLSQMAIRALRSTKGITSVLVGMRQDSYVDDVVQELSVPVEGKDRVDSWNAIARVLK